MGLDMAQQAIEAHESRELVMKMGTYKAKPNVSQTELEDCVMAQRLFHNRVVEYGRNDIFSEFNASLIY